MAWLKSHEPTARGPSRQRAAIACLAAIACCGSKHAVDRNMACRASKNRTDGASHKCVTAALYTRLRRFCFGRSGQSANMERNIAIRNPSPVQGLQFHGNLPLPKLYAISTEPADWRNSRQADANHAIRARAAPFPSALHVILRRALWLLDLHITVNAKSFQILWPCTCTASAWHVRSANICRPASATTKSELK